MIDDVRFEQIKRTITRGDLDDDAGQVLYDARQLLAYVEQLRMAPQRVYKIKNPPQENSDSGDGF